MNRGKQALADLRRGHNADAYVAVGAAVSFGLLGLLNLLDLRWTVPILMLCLVPIINLLLGLHDRIPEPDSRQLTPLTEWPATRLLEDWSRNTDLLLVGVTLIRTVRSAESSIADRLHAGRTVRVLLCDPTSRSVMEQTDSRRRFGPPDPDGNANEVALTLATLQRIRTSEPNGNLQVRTIDFPIATGAIAFSPGQPNARLYVSIYPYRTGETQPHFVIERAHGHWFDHYSEELENLWQAGHAWPPTAPSSAQAVTDQSVQASSGETASVVDTR